MGVVMDHKYIEAGRIISMKQRCEKYIEEMTEDFINFDGEEVRFAHVTGKAILRRDLCIAKELKQSLDNRNISVDKFMQHMVRDAMHRMVQHWLRTLPAYEPDAEYPGGHLLNVFAWSEMSGTYGYIILGAQAYVWKVQADMVEDVQEYMKLANRFFECINTAKGEVCKAYLRFRPVDMDQIPQVHPQAHIESSNLSVLLHNAKSSGDVMLNIAEHLIARTLDSRNPHIIPDIVHTSDRDRSLNIMVRPEKHNI